MRNQHRVFRVLAIDGGGSKTIAWIANVVFTHAQTPFKIDVVGRGVAGPSNPRSVGFESAFDSLSDAVDQAIRQSTFAEGSIDVACLSLAGVGRNEEQARVQAWASERRLAQNTIVVNDVEPLHLAAMLEEQQRDSSTHENMNWDYGWEQSVTLVVGTGSIAYGRNGESRSTRAGGWGYLLGDQGSGFSMGLSGLQSVCESYDCGESLTTFQASLLDHLQLTDPIELVGFVYKTIIPRVEIAELSELVLDYAETDSIARQIRQQSIEAITRLVSVTTRRLDLRHESYSLALSGGILANHPVMVDQLLLALREQHLSPRKWQLIQQPIHGPLLMAARQLKISF
jgi:N-acetylglucosamine kinase-like BadF-type ATPase